MSAAARHRRKKKETNREEALNTQLQTLLALESLDEATAYEALQLAQSQVRKKVHAGAFAEAVDLCYSTCVTLLQHKRVSVASQLMDLLVEVLLETHTEDTDAWIDKLESLNNACTEALKDLDAKPLEILRLHRLQRDWLRKIMSWSSDVGKIQLGHQRFHGLLAEECIKLSTLEEDQEEIMSLQCDAVQHLALAENPNRIVEWLATMPDPTDEELKSGHTCQPCLREALLTRAMLTLIAFENVRDANTLLRTYISDVEKRSLDDLAKSYTSKEDGLAPSHIIFNSMLMRLVEKDARTGPLFTWLMRSFKRELDFLYKPQVVYSYTTKIGKVYFNIQPPPSMLGMVENMMQMMGGGGGMPGGMNPAMMQAMAAQLQQGGMM